MNHELSGALALEVFACSALIVSVLGALAFP